MQKYDNDMTERLTYGNFSHLIPAFEWKIVTLQKFTNIRLMQTSEKKCYELPESLAKNLGIQLISVEEGYVKATMPVDERTSRPCEPVDILNGGASLALAETVAGYGSIPLCEPGQMPCGIQISANHVHMVPIGTYVEAVGKLVHRGRTSHVWNVDITTPEGKLVSTARIVNLIVKKRL